MKTGIVILNYNDYITTKEIIEKIKDYKTLDLIVVVDNNSTDNSYEKLKIYENEKIVVINSNSNKGYSYGNNIGSRYLKEKGIEYIIISNPDIIFKEEDIEKLIDNFKEEKTAVVAPLIEQNGEIIKGWKFPNVFIDGMSNINFIGRYFKKMLLYKQETKKVDVTSGCFFIIKADILEQIDYFDEKVFLYYEENILAKKIKNCNLDIVIDSSVSIIHNHSVTIDKIYNKIKKFKILSKSQRYYHKRYNNSNIFGILFLYITYYIALCISHILLVGEVWKRKK